MHSHKSSRGKDLGTSIQAKVLLSYCSYISRHQQFYLLFLNCGNICMLTYVWLRELQCYFDPVQNSGEFTSTLTLKFRVTKPHTWPWASLWLTKVRLFPTNKKHVVPFSIWLPVNLWIPRLWYTGRNRSLRKRRCWRTCVMGTSLFYPCATVELQLTPISHFLDQCSIYIRRKTRSRNTGRRRKGYSGFGRQE